ncbi:MAG TPA: sporadic carbohydrate cluster 2OG-Fe(II) oxygenase [Ilumatobacteraceae bacterium]|nr:sporadic carbohydrate cluster 2OG-Fe(II) oxygenase [Ilumatobacteraceae bacterium]
MGRDVPSDRTPLAGAPTTLDAFARDGFVIVDASDPASLDRLRDEIVGCVAEMLGISPDDLGPLDELHRHVAPGEPAMRFRQRLTELLTQRHRVGRSVFDAFSEHLRPLVGNDVLAQRVPNLVVQPPQDPRPTELHRDAPANSPYEVVAWVPFVDCERTKSMYLLDRATTDELLDLHRRHPDEPVIVQEFLEHRSTLVEVRYGQALLFWSGLLHGSWTNDEDTTRLSMNLRFKSLFAPLGIKDPLRYFEVLETSPLTRLGLGFQLDAMVEDVTRG